MNLLLVWTLPPKNSFLHKIIDVNLPNFITIETMQQGIVPGGMKGHWVQVTNPWTGVKCCICLVMGWQLGSSLNYLQLASGCTREKKACPPKVKAETWLAPLLHLDSELRVLHLLKCDCHLFPFKQLLLF